MAAPAELFTEDRLAWDEATASAELRLEEDGARDELLATEELLASEELRGAGDDARLEFTELDFFELEMALELKVTLELRAVELEMVELLLSVGTTSAPPPPPQALNAAVMTVAHTRWCSFAINLPMDGYLFDECYSSRWLYS